MEEKVRPIPVPGIGIGPILPALVLDEYILRKYRSRYLLCMETAARPLLIDTALHQLSVISCMV